uniref:Uncharacterized protein n=1 Tax=viral metagenome TaxID=1070528 RepID=A0A6M3L7L3_9ZZZZ
MEVYYKQGRKYIPLEIKNLTHRLEAQTQRLAESEEEVGHLKKKLEESEKMIIALRYDRNFWRDEHGRGSN